MYGYDDSSAALTPYEESMGGRYDAPDSRVLALNIESKNYVYFRYQNDILSTKCNLTVSLQATTLTVN